MARSQPLLALLLLSVVAMAATPSFAQTEMDADMLANADTQGPPEDDDEPELVLSMMESETEPEPTPEGPCTHIRMPPQLCSACKMKEHNDMGIFPGDNQRDIYEIDAACKKQLDTYAQWNSCDMRYGNAIKTYDSLNSSKRRVAYFLYAVCETCCDCIPFGAGVDEYDQRRADNTLFEIKRGNCAAHFWWDTCKLWPEIRTITGRNGKPKDSTPNVCDKLEVWLNSPNGKGWPKNPMVTGLKFHERRILKEVIKRTACNRKEVWQTCVNLEASQDRI